MPDFAYESGRLAGYQRHPLSTNPYQSGTPHHRIWTQGYLSTHPRSEPITHQVAPAENDPTAILDESWPELEAVAPTRHPEDDRSYGLWQFDERGAERLREIVQAESRYITPLEDRYPLDYLLRQRHCLRHGFPLPCCECYLSP